MCLLSCLPLCGPSAGHAVDPVAPLRDNIKRESRLVMATLY